MKKKNFYCLLLLFSLISCIIYFNYSNIFNKYPVTSKYEKENTNNNLLSIYISDEDDVYTLLDDNIFPTDNYEFNQEKSYCINGSSISFLSDISSISIKTTGAERCYIYFDKIENTSAAVYGTSIPDYVVNDCSTDLYTNEKGLVSEDTYPLGTVVNSRGNCNYTYTISPLQTDDYENKYLNYSYNYRGVDYIYSGTNTYTFTESKTNIWIRLMINAGGMTSSASLTNLKLCFSDGYCNTLNESVAAGYIEPLVLYTSSAASTSYLFSSMEYFASAGTTGTGNYANLRVLFKVKEYAFTSFTAYSNRTFNTTYDGYSILEFPETFDMSIQPF